MWKVRQFSQGHRFSVWLRRDTCAVLVGSKAPFAPVLAIAFMSLCLKIRLFLLKTEPHMTVMLEIRGMLSNGPKF